MSTLAWILVAALAAVLALCAGLVLALRRSRARTARTEQLVTEARRAVRAAAEEESAAQGEQLRIAIARAQADSLSAYVAEERRLSDQRRGELTVRERDLSDRMAELVAAVEQRVEERLRAWESDLERAQNALQGAVSTLEAVLRCLCPRGGCSWRPNAPAARRSRRSGGPHTGVHRRGGEDSCGRASGVGRGAEALGGEDAGGHRSERGASAVRTSCRSSSRFDIEFPDKYVRKDEVPAQETRAELEWVQWRRVDSDSASGRAARRAAGRRRAPARPGGAAGGPRPDLRHTPLRPHRPPPAAAGAPGAPAGAARAGRGRSGRRARRHGAGRRGVARRSRDVAATAARADVEAGLRAADARPVRDVLQCYPLTFSFAGTGRGAAGESRCD